MQTVATAKANDMLWLVFVIIDEVSTVLFASADADDVAEFIFMHFVSTDEYCVVGVEAANDC